jgi:hypothetical protein
LPQPTASFSAHCTGRRVGGLLVALGVLAFPLASARAQRVLTVVARDTMLEIPPTVPAGVTTVRLSLQGKTRRELVVHRVPSGTQPEVVARGAAGRTMKWFEQWSFGGPAVPRDSAPDASVTMDLRPGRYVIVAYAVDSSGRARGDRFIWRDVTAMAAAVLIPGRFPVPDATIKVKDARIDVTGIMRAGQRTLHVENVGSRPHEVVIGRLRPGKTLDDVRRWDVDRGAEPPFVYVGGITPMSSRGVAQTRLVLQSGVHVVFCPIREGRGARDYVRGVLGSFKVN